MNTIAFAIRINEKCFFICRQWPKRHIRFLARRKLNELKRKWRDGCARVAAAIIPLPKMAAA